MVKRREVPFYKYFNLNSAEIPAHANSQNLTHQETKILYHDKFCQDDAQIDPTFQNIFVVL